MGSLLLFGDLNGNGAMDAGDKLDTLAELGSDTSLALQAVADRQSQLYTALSNALKATGTVALAAIRNIK